MPRTQKAAPRAVVTFGLLPGLLLVCASLSGFAQKPPTESASGELTVERVSAEADLGVESRSDAAQKTPLLHWSPDGMRVAWVHLISPPPHSMVKTAQYEIWAMNAAQDGSVGNLSAGEPSLLVPAARVTASLRGTDVPRPLSINDDDTSNPDLLQDFAWSPDHAALLLVNAQSMAWLDLASGKARVLLTSEEPIADAAIAPDGKTVSFVRGHGVWVVSAAGGTAHPLLAQAPKPDVLRGELDWPYRNELHLELGYLWSPDSARIAYLETDDRATDKYQLRASDGSTRAIVYPKPGGALPLVRLMVKGVAAGLPVEIRLPADASKGNGVYLPRFNWLPDGRHISVQRLNRRQQILELFIADALTGKAQLVLTETDKYWINLFGDPIFLKDGKRFVWSSERTGFRHLYLYDVTGKQLAQLTHGDWEVTRLHAIDEGKGRVYFTATEKSPLERHLYSVSLNGGDQVQVTQVPGTHELSIAPGGGYAVDSYSSHATPPRLEFFPLGGAAVKPASQAVAEAVPNLLPVEYLSVKLHMGMDVDALMIKPPAFDEAKKYPVIVCLAGGPGEQLVRDVWGGATGLWMQLMARKGYIIFALDNQGTAGRGHYFEEPLHFRLAAQEMIDQRDGVTYLQGLPYVDSARLGVWGWGYGGFLATHAMLDRPVLFKAGFAGAPIVDWHLYDAVFAERYLDDPVAHLAGWLSSSAVPNAKFLKGPLLLAQGTADEFVHMENLLTLQDSLLNSGKTAEVLLLANRDHRIEDDSARQVLFRRMTEFFLKNL